MRFFANGQEITETEFNRINDENAERIAEFEKTGNYGVLLDMIFLTQVHA